MNSHFMTQMAHAPTHGRNCLDLVLTNNVNLISSIGTEQNDASLMDHNLLKVMTTTEPGKKGKSRHLKGFLHYNHQQVQSQGCN